MKLYFLQLLFITLLMPALALAGQGDFSPHRTGITFPTHPHGTDTTVSFNNFTDNTLLGKSRRYIPYNLNYETAMQYVTDNQLQSYIDERDFLLARKKYVGDQDKTTVYSHRVGGLQKGDQIRLHWYVHNNAKQVCGGANFAQNTTLSLDWSDPQKVVGGISALNAQPQTINDIVDFDFANANLGLELNDVYYYKRNDPDGTVSGVCGSNDLSYSSQIRPQLNKENHKVRFSLGNIPGSYGGNHFIYVDLTVVEAPPSMVLEKQFSVEDVSTVAPGEMVSVAVTVRNRGVTPLKNVIVTDVLDQLFTYVSGDDGIAVDGQRLTLTFPEVQSVAVKNFQVRVSSEALKGDKICNVVTGVADSITTVTSNEDCIDIDDLGVCGNGIIEDSEECDDGNTESGDGCSERCLIEACGNERIDHGESCDDGNTDSGDGCSSLCQTEIVCGDGTLSEGEECDDGNTESGDGCSERCLIEACGNERIDHGESCDDGNTDSGDGCSSLCQTEIVCGDGTLSEGEECDDGNTESGDGCSATCEDESGGGGGPGGNGGSPNVNHTIGTCAIDSNTGAAQCVARYPVEDLDNSVYQDYRACIKDVNSTVADCLLAWAAEYEYQVCGTDLGAGIEVPIVGDIDPANVASQCEFVPPLTPAISCQAVHDCPNCFSGFGDITTEVKSVDGTYKDRTKIAKGDLVMYKVNLTLGTSDIYTQKILDGGFKVYDFTVPSDSGNLWNRDGLSDAWSWSNGGKYFHHELTSEELTDLNTAGGTTYQFEYQMDSALAFNKDSAQLKNVNFAVFDYQYIDMTCRQQKVQECLLKTGSNCSATAEAACTQGKQITLGGNLCGAEAQRNLLEGATLGSSATVELIRPFVEARNGNMALVSNDKDEKIMGDKGVLSSDDNTSGVLLVPDLDVNGVFDFQRSQEIDDEVESFLDQSMTTEDLDQASLNTVDTENYFGKLFKTSKDQSGVYFLANNGTLELGGELDLEGESKTFVIKSGTIQIKDDFMLTNGYAAFVLESGTIEIGTNVEQIEGLYLIHRGEFRSRNFGLGSQVSSNPLRVQGSFLGDIFPLLKNRTFIGLDPDNQLEPNVRFVYDIRISNQTLPLIEEYLGEK